MAVLGVGQLRGLGVDTRAILRVTMEDAVEASKLFDELMGDEVEPRRLFIERNAKYVTNLDV